MVVIVGEGIAVAASAYYLSCCQPTINTSFPTATAVAVSQLNVTIIDAAGRPAAGASGKAGAYLSKHWGDRTKRDTLFRKSFAMHEELARDLDLPSFRYVPSYRVEIGEAEEQITKETSWMDRASSVKSLPGSSAIVDPEELTKTLVDHAVQNGATFMAKSVCGFDMEGMTVTSIRFDDGDSLDLKLDEDVVIALGPWSSRIEVWFHIPLPMDGVLSTSLIWDSINTTADDSSSTVPSCFDAAVFCEEDGNGCHLEILPRRDGSLYVSGCGGSDVWSPQVFRSPQQCPRPETPCVPNMARATAAQKSLQTLLHGAHHNKNNEEKEKNPFVVPPPDCVQACIRPVSPDGVPIVGPLKPLRNVFVATGGGAWGITFGPLMGKCLANLLLTHNGGDADSTGGTPPVRLASLAPSRFDTILYRTFLEQRKSKNF